MGVNFISGKPGGGKSLYAMRLLLAELRLSKRKIVTNLCVRFEALNEYLGKQGIDLGETHIRERVQVISEEQLPEFYRYRGAGPLPGAMVDGEFKTDYSGITDAGVLYVIDEVHIAFNSRRWANTGRGVIYYLSQHRKLGDDVILVTQHVNNVDKQMRSMAQDYTYIRNLRKEKAGVFKLPGVFIRQTFLQPASEHARATETGSFTLDVKGVAACYDTAAGVGIHGRAADTLVKARGVHWLVFPVVLIALVFALAHYTPALADWLITPRGLPSQARVKASGAAPVPSQVLVAAPASPNVAPSAAPVRWVQSTNTFMAGFYKLPGELGWTVLLTDGRQYSEGDGRLQLLTQGACVIDGIQYAIKSK